MPRNRHRPADVRLSNRSVSVKCFQTVRRYGVDAEEYAALGQLMGERLAASKGPLRVLIPAGGWSQLVGRKTYDLSGMEIGNWSQPETDRIFVDTLRQYLPANALAELPQHINEQAFADACIDNLITLLRRCRR